MTKEIEQIHKMKHLPRNHEEFELIINSKYYDLVYTELGAISGIVSGVKTELVVGDISTILIDQVQYTMEIQSIEITETINDNICLLVKGNKKTVAYLFLLPLCDIVREVPALPVCNVFLDRDDSCGLILQVGKLILPSRDGLDIIKEDERYIYIKSHISDVGAKDLMLIHAGMYSKISDESKEKIYNYHLCSFMVRDKSSLYDVFEKTQKRRDQIYDKYGVMPDKDDELYSKITEKEYYE